MTLLLLFLLLPLFFFRLGQSSLVSFDEAWYAEISRNILKTGNPFLLFFNGASFYDHPPAVFWLMTLSYLFLGINEFSVRFVSAFLGFGSLILTYLIGKKLFNKQVGLFSSLMLVSSVWFIIRARSGNLDIPLVFFILLCFDFTLRIREKKIFLYLLGSCLAFLLLIKTFAGVGVLLVVFYSLFQQRKRIKKKDFIKSIFLFFLILLPFYLINFYTYGFSFLKRLWLISQRGKVGILDFNFKLPFFYLHMGVREWYYPFLIAFIGNLFFLGKNKNLRLIYLYLFCFIYPYIKSTKTEIWHLIPLYPAMGLMIFSFVNNMIEFCLNFIKKGKERLELGKLVSLLLFLGTVLFTIKQINEFWSESLGKQSSISDEAKMAKAAVNYDQPLFFTDIYFPVAVFYSQKNIYWIGEEYLGKEINSLEDLFAKVDSFLLLTTDNLLRDNRIKEEDYFLIKQVGDKILIKKR